MTLVVQPLSLMAAVVVLIVAMALGLRALSLLRIQIHNDLEALLFAAGLGVFVIELSTFVLSIPGWLRPASAWVLVLVAAAVAGTAWRQAYKRSAACLKRIHAHWTSRDWRLRTLCLAIVAVAAFEALVASTPLTGSDAMHYHFTVPLLQLHSPLAPRFDITHSFLLGEAHLLISLGLALGSDRIALELVFLGGLLTAATMYAIARKLVAMPLWPLFGVLVFLVSPMVLWQAAASGSPDIWMGFYLGIAVLAASRALEKADARMALLAGFFAGSAAGVKYTGWTVPMAICGYLFFYFRPRTTAIWSGVVAFLAGCLPLVRNAVWTRDPFFPFLSRWLNPAHVDSYALNFLLVDTRSNGFSRHLGHILAFPFLLTIQGDRLGLGQYFGPVILALAPLLFFLPWKNHLVRLAAAVWALAFLANIATAQMGRFLLPVFGLALALVFAGIARAAELRWRAAVAAAAACLVLFVAFAAAADAVYFGPALSATASSAPDFALSAFVNNALQARAKQQPGAKALVYYRHLYYLRIPFINADPGTSWLFDPAVCGQASRLLEALHQNNVRWVVKTSDYPQRLTSAFDELEQEGKLTPIAHADVETTRGTTRLARTQITVPVTIFELRNQSP